MSGRDVESAALLALGDEIARYAKPRASARLRTELRRSLLNAPVAQPRRFTFSLAPLRPLLATAVVVAILAGTAGVAAASSLPGDPAFALKRAVESIEVALAPDDVARLDALVTQADHRLSDLHTALAARPGAVGAAVEEYALAVARVDAAAEAVASEPRSARRDAALALAGAVSQSHLDILRTLATTVPAPARPGIDRAIDAQQRIHGRSTPPARPTTSPTPHR